MIALMAGCGLILSLGGTLWSKPGSRKTAASHSDTSETSRTSLADKKSKAVSLTSSPTTPVQSSQILIPNGTASKIDRSSSFASQSFITLPSAPSELSSVASSPSVSKHPPLRQMFDVDEAEHSAEQDAANDDIEQDVEKDFGYVV